MSLNDGGPAFPHLMSQTRRGRGGMTMRDYFAGQALGQVVAAAAANDPGMKEAGAILGEGRALAVAAYAIADAMLHYRRETG